MLDLLKNIPLVDNLRRSHEGSGWLANIDDHRAKVEVCSISLAISLFINRSESLPTTTLRYLTLLLGAHPDLHDYALQLTVEGGWLCGYYEKNISAELISNEIEKHLALTRYLQSVIDSQSKNYSGDRYDVRQ